MRKCSNKSAPTTPRSTATAIRAHKGGAGECSGFCKMFALCKKFQLFFCLGERLSVYSDINTMSILAQTESKELDFLLCEDTGHLALFRVHFQFQPAFQILPAGFQQALCYLWFPHGIAAPNRPLYHHQPTASLSLECYLEVHGYNSRGDPLCFHHAAQRVCDFTE